MKLPWPHVHVCIYLCLHVESVSRSKDYARSWIKTKQNWLSYAVHTCNAECMFCLTLHIQMSLSVCSVVCCTHMCHQEYVLSHDVRTSRRVHVLPCAVHTCVAECMFCLTMYTCRRVYVLSHDVHTCRRVCQKWRVNLCITLRDIRMGGRDILVEFMYLVGIRMLGQSCRGLFGSLLLLCLCLFSTIWHPLFVEFA